MPWWGWLIIVGSVGVAAIAVGGLRDRTMRRRRAAMLTAPPPPVPGVDGGDARPRYVSLEEARQPRTPDALPPLDAAARALIAGPPVELGLAGPQFATTADGYATAEHPIVLVCAEPVGSLRELYPALTAARNTGAPLVIVAPGSDATTTQTLAINVTQRLLHVIMVTGDADARATAAERCTAQPVDRSDLQAGYLPHGHLGGCRLWVSATEHTWIAPTDDARATGTTQTTGTTHTAGTAPTADTTPTAASTHTTETPTGDPGAPRTGSRSPDSGPTH